MEWIGLICLAFLLFYISYPGRVRDLERKVKKLEKKAKGEQSMSKIIEELVGCECVISSDEFMGIAGRAQLKCEVLAVDDEWLKISYIDKKDNLKVKIVRIDAVDSIELLEITVE